MYKKHIHSLRTKTTLLHSKWAQNNPDSKKIQEIQHDSELKLNKKKKKLTEHAIYVYLCLALKTCGSQRQSAASFHGEGGKSLRPVSILHNTRSQSFFMSDMEGLSLFQGQCFHRSGLLVSACALGPGACGGDVQEGLPQLRSPLQVIHVGCGGLSVWAYGEKNKIIAVQYKDCEINVNATPL